MLGKWSTVFQTTIAVNPTSLIPAGFTGLLIHALSCHGAVGGNGVTVTGATTGNPVWFWRAEAAEKTGSISFGVAPIKLAEELNIAISGSPTFTVYYSWH